jgi:hypothetical protein
MNRMRPPQLNRCLRSLTAIPGVILTNPSSPSKKTQKEEEQSSVKASPPDPEPTDPERTEPTPVEPEPEPRPLARQEEYPEQLSHMLAADFHSLSYPLLAPRKNYSGTCELAADFDKD